MTKHNALPVQGIDLFEETLRLKKILSTGCQPLDELLEGGLFTQEMLEIYGPPSVGKTQIALTLTSHVINTMEANVIYIDTSASFIAKRLIDILQSNMADSFSQQAVHVILSRVKCHKLFNVFEVLTELENLKEKLSLEHDSFSLNLKLIVIDSINSVITPVLGKDQHGHALMSKVGYLLKEIAYEYGISVLVLNSATGHYEKDNSSSSSSSVFIDRLKPALGKTWLSVPHVRLFMDFVTCSGESFQRTVKVVKHPRLPTKMKVVVYIGKYGVQSCETGNGSSTE